MAISITEKEHWKERIGKKLDTRIQTLKMQDSAYFFLTEEKARTQALAALGIADDFQEMEELAAEIDSKAELLKNRIISLIEVLTGKKDTGHYGSRSRLDSLLRPHVQKQEAELLGRSELGRQVALLEAEKENLMDTIWLATSPRQMSEMWGKVLKLIGEETTAFQREIITGVKAVEE
jgi:hypothetical protein